jgi:hypothetical protein
MGRRLWWRRRCAGIRLLDNHRRNRTRAFGFFSGWHGNRLYHCLWSGSQTLGISKHTDGSLKLSEESHASPTTSVDG